ncbi:MAG: YhgE/Pip family protein, partial [Rhodoglobus sp.]
MKTITLVRSEFARLTASRMGITALLALMLVPVVYGGFYLWGNADPYNALDKVPAAIVVDDVGTTVDDAVVNYGKDAADQLVDDQRFGWVIVSADEAKAGVTEGVYDFSLTFPHSFSADLASAGASDPTRASLVLTTDDTNSYLSTTLAKQAAAAVQAALTQKVGEQASSTLLNAVDSIRTGLANASDGASRLSDAATSASAGATSLASGTSTLAAGAQSLDAGLAELNARAAALPGSASALASGAAGVANGLSVVPGQVGAALTAAGVSAADQQPILAELAALSGAASQVSSGATALGAQAPALVSGISSAASGASTLADGAAAASTGAGQLSAGLAQLASGSSELNGSLASGLAQVSTTTAAGRASTAAAIANPVAVDQHAITQAQNYGAGLAPFFISLAAWIGIYALFLLVRPLSRRALTAVRRPIGTALAGWITPALLGAVQMVALFAVATLALGLHPANAAGLLGFMILVSVTFAAIVLALNIWLGSVG